MEVAHTMLTVLRDNLQVLIENLNSESDVPSDDKKVVLNKCAEMLNIIEKAIKDIGRYDIRRVRGKRLLAELDSLYAMVCAFDMTKNQNQNKSLLKLFFLNLKNVEQNLNQTWNTDLLPPEEEEDEVDVASSSAVTLPTEPVSAANLETPTGKNIRIFEKFSPLFKKADVPDCTVCGTKFTDSRSRSNHYKKKHEIVVHKSAEIMGTCKLAAKLNPSVRCGKKFTKHQINRHLKDVHQIVIPENQFLRGFMSSDGGISWSSVFLSKSDPDPEALVIIQEGEGVQEEDADNEDGNNVTETIEVDEDQIVNLVAGEAVRRNLFDTTEDLKDVEEKDNTEDVEMNDAFVLPEAQQFGTSDTEESGPPIVQELSLSSFVTEKEVLASPIDNVSATFNLKKVTLSVMNEAIYDIENIEERKDSDYEDEDDRDETNQRLIQKSRRHLRRNELVVSGSVKKLFPADEIVAEEFKEYMIKRTVSEGGPKSTVSKAFGHIITYQDSLVQFEYFKDDKFRLKQNVDFGSKDHRDVTYPLEWINETCSDNPPRAVEKLKSHSYWRDFLKLKVTKSSVSTKKKVELNNVIDSISKDINDQKVYRRFNILVNNETVEKRRAKQILNPDEATNVVNAVMTWNESDVKMELDKRMTNYYSDAMVKGKSKLRNREFTQFSHFVRFFFILSDKNRIGVYKFRNVDFSSRSRVWFPDGCDLDTLPKGYNPHKQPFPGKPPSAWVMQVPGSLAGMKKKESVTVCITPPAMVWIERYRDLKDMVDPEPNFESLFFINFNKKELSDSGSNNLWQKFESVTGVSKATVTSIRKGFEDQIRESEDMTDRMKDINNHSKAVGAADYDQTRYQKRAQTIVATASKEAEKAPPKAAVELSDELELRRKEREKQDQEMANEHAKKVLNKDKLRKKNLAHFVKMKNDDRLFLQNLICSQDGKEIKIKTSGKFPVDSKWKKLLFRFLDGGDLDEEDKVKFLKIEETIFLSIKKDILEELGDEEWVGSSEQQSLADFKVAICLKKSFAEYEKNKAKSSKTFFKF